MAVHAKTSRSAPSVIPGQSDFESDVLNGLRSEPKRIPPKHFYDAEGSRLFEEITVQDEYYPTRTEIGILKANAAAISALIPDNSALIEFGSGACTKVRILCDAVPALRAFVPVDISGEFLEQHAAELASAYPGLSIYPVAADFTKPFPLPEPVTDMRKAGFFPGSTIGNFEPHEAAEFLRHAGRVLGRDALMILGVDLIKDAARLNAAYNDAAGVTAKFNRNLLRRINRELDGNFDLRAFEHHAFFNPERSRIEMHLASTKRQKATVRGSTFEFRAGESIHTESSYKYSVASFTTLARGCGWSPVAHWTDPGQLFSVHVLRAE